MPVIIALLRGINVGGHKLVPMERLRVLCGAAGCVEVRTYIQSGNVVLQTPERNAEKLAKRIEKAIAAEFGFHSDVIVRTAAEWKKVIAGNPFAGRTGIDPAKLTVTFLASPVSEAIRQKVLAAAEGKEESHLIGGHLYIYFRDGQGRPQVNMVEIGKALGVPVTTRNWNTVLKLMDLAESLQ